MITPLALIGWAIVCSIALIIVIVAIGFGIAIARNLQPARPNFEEFINIIGAIKNAEENSK